MASCSKLPAAAASAGRFQDLPAELIERIMLPLDHRDRARCEVVCTRWLAISGCCPALPGRVKWVYSAGDQRALAHLRWLARHGPVRQAVLDLAEYRLAEEATAAAASALGGWAHTLEALNLSCAFYTIVCLAGVLPSLAHLTQLRLSGGAVGWEGTSHGINVVSSMSQLRSLSWGVAWCGRGEGPVLPSLPQLEHLRVTDRLWGLPQHLPDHLQSLQIATHKIEELGSLCGLSSLTSLVLSDTTLQELPHGLSTQTALRYLDLSEKPDANFNQDLCDALRGMQLLEYLRLRTV